MKRFWKEAAPAQVETGWRIELDGRAVKTPAKNTLIVPTRDLATEIAQEWIAQDEAVDPNQMPLTRLANSAQEKVATQPEAVADYLAEYGGSDLLCYRAEEPPALVERQAQIWDPLLAWAESQHGLRLQRQSGIMPVLQPEETLQKISSLTRALDTFTLTAFHELVTLAGSWVIAYAALHEVDSAESLWKAAALDELWQAEVWGEDEEAAEVRASKQAAFETGLRFARLSCTS